MDAPPTCVSTASDDVMRTALQCAFAPVARLPTRRKASESDVGPVDEERGVEGQRMMRRKASLARLKVAEIKAELVARGLPAVGKRQELLETLENAVEREYKHVAERREEKKAERVRKQQKWGLWRQYEKREGIVSSREKAPTNEENSQNAARGKGRIESKSKRGSGSASKAQEHAGSAWETEPKWYFLLVRSNRENMVANKVLPELFEDLDKSEREEEVKRALVGLVVPEEILEAQERALQDWEPRELRVINATRKVVVESRTTGKVMARRERVLPNYVLLYCKLDSTLMKHITSKGVYKGIYGFANETVTVYSDGTKVPKPVSDEDLAKILQQCDLETETEIEEAKRLKLFPEKDNGNGGSTVDSATEEINYSPYRIGHAMQAGDLVDVIDGPFKGFSGAIKEVLEAEGKILAELVIFGQETEVELGVQHIHIVRE